MKRFGRIAPAVQVVRAPATLCTVPPHEQNVFIPRIEALTSLTMRLHRDIQQPRLTPRSLALLDIERRQRARAAVESSLSSALWLRTSND